MWQPFWSLFWGKRTSCTGNWPNWCISSIRFNLLGDNYIFNMYHFINIFTIAWTFVLSIDIYYLRHNQWHSNAQKKSSFRVRHPSLFCKRRFKPELNHLQVDGVGEAPTLYYGNKRWNNKNFFQKICKGIPGEIRMEKQNFRVQILVAPEIFLFFLYVFLIAWILFKKIIKPFSLTRITILILIRLALRRVSC